MIPIMTMQALTSSGAHHVAEVILGKYLKWLQRILDFQVCFPQSNRGAASTWRPWVSGLVGRFVRT